MRAYKANMIPGGVTPTINVSQYDNDYAVTVTLIEGAEIYTPPAGATIRVEGTKPDGHGFEYPCTYQGNVVTMPIYTQMTVVSGRFPIELVVYQSGLRVGSCNIIFAVERAPLGEGTDISETVIPDIIAGAQAQADAAAASATQAASSAASAETAKDAAMDAAQDAIDAAQELQTAIQFNAALIHETASGAVASFADGADNIPMKSIVAEITPVQSGTGDPSPTNIRPISGRTGLTVTAVGDNLYHIEDKTHTVNGITWKYSNGVVTGNGTVVNASSFTDNAFIYLPAGTYTIYDYANNTSGYVAVQDASNNTSWRTLATTETNNPSTFTLTETTRCVTRCRLSVGTTVTNTLFKPMLMVGNIQAPTEFKPYTGTEVPITWESIAGTVYGGTLDVVSGVLTVDKGFITYDGSENWNWQDGGTYKRTACPLSDVYNRGGRVSVQSNAGTFRASGNDVGTIFASGTTLFYYPDASITSPDAYKTWLASNNLQVVYPLATPQTYQLTPTEVRTILGGNNIYTDAGDVSVEYIADTKMYIDNKIAELQALVLEN